MTLLTLLHLERPKLHTVLGFLSVTGSNEKADGSPFKNMYRIKAERVSAET